MNKFWEWMDEKGYGAKDGLFFLTNSEGKMWLNPMPQMIIGYMMEYLFEFDSRFMCDYAPIEHKCIKSVYDWLEAKIKSVGNGKK